MTHIGQSVFAISLALILLGATEKEEDSTLMLLAFDPATNAGISASVTNGRAWIALDKQSRIMYVNGLEEGIYLKLLHGHEDEPQEMQLASAQKTFEELTISGFRMSDIVEQIDSVYSDSANIKLPTLEVYRYALSRMKGTPTSVLDAKLTELRRKYNQ